MKRIEKVFETVKELCEEQLKNTGKISGVSTEEIARRLSIHRPNASSDLNLLVKENRIEKIEGKPVLYRIMAKDDNGSGKTQTSPLKSTALDEIIGAKESLRTAVLQAKAAMMYPPMGLHTLLLGETGTGKSMFAEAMFNYAQEIGRLGANAPFIYFNCADYAHNPQLLISQLFGVKKGSYTGADRDRAGLVEKASGGILFLDEVHRLPPEGQEMLFYLIDKGMYRSLGEIDATHRARVLIICATTENLESALLRTFIRRIPMIIKLPSLRERTLSERWQLIKAFFKEEADYLKTKITVSANSIKAFLLYDCPNNIGQLKTDIKLSCARAFIQYMSNKDTGLIIHSEDLPEYVRTGLLRYKEFRQNLRQLGIGDESIVFESDGENVNTVKPSDSFSIYEALEEKMRLLKEKGLGENDINLILSLDIETFIRKYMSKLDGESMEQLYKIVDKKVVNIIRNFLTLASEKMKKTFADKIFYGMAIHISSTLERIRNGKSIFNPHLDEIKKSYPVEFGVASILGRSLKENFGIDVPEDEIGFITMFLVLDDYAHKKDHARVGVIVAMHGDSTATSMVDVAARLLGEKHALGYNMPLDQKPETALENLTQLVKEVNEGKGVLMLVDMGSLVFFGDMIYERTGIPIKTVEMVSTPMVLEAARKALMMSSLEEVYYSVVNLSPYLGRIYMSGTAYESRIKDDVIITACITGTGAAVKMKNILEKLIKDSDRKADIIPIDIASIEEYNRKLSQIKREKNIIAVVSAIKPDDETLTYISPKDLIEGKVDDLILKLACSKQSDEKDENIVILNRMRDVIRENIEIDAEKYIDGFIDLYKSFKAHGINLNEDMLVGLVLHLACAIEKMMTGSLPKHGNTAVQTDTLAKQSLAKQYKSDFDLIKEALTPMEKSFNVKLPEEEYINFIKIIHFL
ncbi:MAG: hypothetical protein PWQ68_1217 [Thermoanaerobacteraceae bacterium]|nr:hypothetical protein [Thermoanaerobacteraceae bacterium]